ncbi:MAG TPA: hypothetical protein VNQ90_13280 [Chthoniobacteraceae bacterium]|nr:hypothetical protein [Chthoniobacteraceae bacterium]
MKVTPLPLIRPLLSFLSFVIMLPLFSAGASPDAPDRQNLYLNAVEDHLDRALQGNTVKARDVDALLAATAWSYQDPASRHYQDRGLLKLMARAIDQFFLDAAVPHDVAPETAPPALETLYRDPPMVNVSYHQSHRGVLMAFIAAIRNPAMAEALGPERLRAIRRSLEKHAAYWRDLEKSPTHEQPWFYGVAILNLTYAYLSTGDTGYLHRTSHWFDELYRCRGSDGALEYMRNTPYFGPVYWYTDSTLYELGMARLAVSTLPEAASFVQKLDEFARGLVSSYKKNLISPGYNEYYSVIWWKHLPRTSSMPFATGALAFMTGDPQIAYLALEETRRGLFYDNRTLSTRTLASGLFVRAIASIRPEPLPDDYAFYDANRIGIRGRFGAFNYTVQAGAHAGTMAGATLLTKGRDLKAILQRVTPIIRKNPNPAAGRDDLGSLWILSWHPGKEPAPERPPVGVVHAGNLGVVATTYHPLSSHWAEDGKLEERLERSGDWLIGQLWFTTPERIVGYARTTCLKPNKAYGVALWNSFSQVDTLSRLDDHRYLAGGLIYHIHEHDYPRVGQAPSRAYVARHRDKQWVGLYLTDETGGVHYLEEKMTPPHDYAAGDSWHAIVDIYPEGTPPADVRLLLERDGVIALRIRDSEARYIALFNAADQATTLTFSQLQLPPEAEPTIHRGVSGASVEIQDQTIELPSREALLLKL